MTDGYFRGMRSVLKRVPRWMALVILLLLLMGGAEAWVRTRIFGDDPAYADWRDPDLFTWRYRVDGHVVRSDDHAKLAVRWGRTAIRRDHLHALLGWHGDLDSLTLLPPGFERDTGRTPLVLLGWGWTRHHAADVLLRDSALLQDHQVVLLSVAELALDQDLLLLEHTRTALPGAQVFLWVDLDELDRLHRSFLDRPKPFFIQDVYTGVLHGVPLPADPGTWLDTHPPDPGLYAYHLFRSRVLSDTTMSTGAAESRERQLCELAKKLLVPMVRASGSNGQQVSVLLEQATFGDMSDRRRWAVHDACREAHASFHPVNARGGLLPGEMAVLLVREKLTHGERVSDLDSLFAALDRPMEQLTPLQHRMATILKDADWMALVRRKAGEQGVPLVTMVERDARYMEEHTADQ